LLTKADKSPFEEAMLRYYPVTQAQLYYQQALLATYKENIPAALTFMKKISPDSAMRLPANPFNSRLSDCHDCEAEEKGKKYTPLQFLQTIQVLKNNLQAGKEVYSSALQLGSAYYNITHYGNSRVFYQTDLNGGTYQPNLYAKEFEQMYTSPRLAEKYYTLALQNATTAEQKAKCSFLLSKCERNAYYNRHMKQVGNSYEPETDLAPAGSWFAALKNKYAATAYYREVLKECGYFRKYVAGK
jgi:hypothetical protein